MNQAGKTVLSAEQIHTLQGTYTCLTGITTYLTAHACCVIPEDEQAVQRLIDFAVLNISRLTEHFDEVAAVGKARPAMNWRTFIKPDRKDVAVFLIGTALVVFRVPMPVEFVANLPWPVLILALLFLVWITGSYFIGAVGAIGSVVSWVVKFLRRQP